MAALDFPASPTNGQVYANWIYSTAKGAWQAKPITGKVTTSAVAPSAPTNGDEWFNTNDGNLYVYYTDVDGSQWVQVKSDGTLSSTLGNRVTSLEAYPSGLVPTIPTSISVNSGSATVNTIGTITFSGATNLSVNGVFSSAYTDYRIVADFSGSSANTSTQLRIRKAGVDYSGAQYNFGGIGARSNGTTAAFVGASSTTWSLSWINGPAAGAGSSAGSIDLFNPYGNGGVTYQKMVSTFVGGDGTSMAGIYVGGNCFSGQLANDGFTLQVATGTFGGTVTVYGLR